jgi:hypothetical protein
MSGEFIKKITPAPEEIFWKSNRTIKTRSGSDPLWPSKVKFNNVQAMESCKAPLGIANERALLARFLATKIQTIHLLRKSVFKPKKLC